MNAPLSLSLLLAVCRALDVTPVGYPDGRLALSGPPDVLPRITPHAKAQQAAFLALLAAESDAAYRRQQAGFRVVRVYDVAADRWHDVSRTDERVRLADCRQDPQRGAILAAFMRATAPQRAAA